MKIGIEAERANIDNLTELSTYQQLILAISKQDLENEYFIFKDKSLKVDGAVTKELKIKFSLMF